MLGVFWQAGKQGRRAGRQAGRPRCSERWAVPTGPAVYNGSQCLRASRVGAIHNCQKSIIFSSLSRRGPGLALAKGFAGESPTVPGVLCRPRQKFKLARECSLCVCIPALLALRMRLRPSPLNAVGRASAFMCMASRLAGRGMGPSKVKIRLSTSLKGVELQFR